MTDAKNLVAVSQEDREAAEAFFRNWPRVSIPSYFLAALAEAMRDHRLASAPSGEGEEIARELLKQAHFFAGNILVAGPAVPSRYKWDALYGLAGKIQEALAEGLSIRGGKSG